MHEEQLQESAGEGATANTCHGQVMANMCRKIQKISAIASACWLHIAYHLDWQRSSVDLMLLISWLHLTFHFLHWTDLSESYCCIIWRSIADWQRRKSCNDADDKVLWRSKHHRLPLSNGECVDKCSQTWLKCSFAVGMRRGELAQQRQQMWPSNTSPLGRNQVWFQMNSTQELDHQIVKKGKQEFGIGMNWNNWMRFCGKGDLRPAAPCPPLYEQL